MTGCGCGQFGCQAKGLRIFTMIVSTFFAVLVTLLVIVALAGWSTDSSNLVKIAWAKADVTDTSGSTPTSTKFYGLQGWYDDSYKTFTGYGDDKCEGDFCSRCKTSGYAVLGLFITSFFLSIGVILCTVIRICKDSEQLKIAAIVLTFLVGIFLASGFASWNYSCYESLTSGYFRGINIDLMYFSGYGAAAAAWVLTFLLFFAHMFCASTEESEDTASLSNNPAAKV